MIMVRQPVKSLLGSLAVAMFVTATAAGRDKPAADAAKPAHIFVTGHSFHMPIVQPLEQMAKFAGIDGTKIVGKQGIGGSTVSQHWDKDDASNLAKKAIKTGEVDLLTMAPNQLLPDPAIDKFTALLLENNPNGRVTVQASWYPVDGPPNTKGSFKNAQRDAADPTTFHKTWNGVTNKVRAQVNALNEKYADKYHRPVAFMVPVGEAVIRLRERVVKGQVPGIAKQSDLFRDDLGHGKPPIYVLNAYCHFAVIFGRTPVGLPVPDMLKTAGLGENTEKVNRILQEVAWEAVTAEPASGVKVATAK
jgi:hypothetical protein